jgi:hypothetical protein
MIQTYERKSTKLEQILNLENIINSTEKKKIRSHQDSIEDELVQMKHEKEM